MANPERQPLSLRAAPGIALAPGLAADFARLKTFSHAARKQLYRVLGPMLADPPPDVSAQVGAFCAEFGVSSDDLLRALSACRFLLRQAAAVDLSEEHLREDFARLGDEGELAESLLPGYEVAVRLVRDELGRAALTDHGKVVERVDWRVDRVEDSNRADRLHLGVLVVTMTHREAGTRERITLHLGADAARELRAACDRYLAR
ncbi:MAG TPA: hypothetical protein VGG39_21160 [Polyangiaceae bacterium]|jgi:hypothetical protein